MRVNVLPALLNIPNSTNMIGRVTDMPHSSASYKSAGLNSKEIFYSAEIFH